MICRKIKCKEYLTDDGEPAWCFLAGQPAEVAKSKCPNRENGKLKESAMRMPEKPPENLPVAAVEGCGTEKGTSTSK